MATVEQLYQYFGVLADAKDKAGEHEKEYLAILTGVKGGPSEKRLASQFIARFFKYFPGVAEKALDAQFDLCEDDDINIRKQAIKDLPALCKDSPEHLTRIADVLTQLLQSDDPGELSLVQTSLIALSKSNPKASLHGLFGHILQGEDLVREHAIKFLRDKLSSIQEEYTKEVEDYIIEESKKVLQDVTGDEFIAFMKILSSLKSMATMQGRQQMVEIVAEQADLDKEFEASDPDCADRLIQCVKQVVPLFSKNVHSTRFFVYVCDKVLPVLGEISNVEEDDDNQQGAALDVQLEILKLCAEMSEHSGDMDKMVDRTTQVFNTLLVYMPLPPSEDNAENTDTNAPPRFQFSHVECLMYTFQQLAQKCPEVLTADEHAERLKDFRVRLQYLARGVQVYIKQLKMALQGKMGDTLKTDENKIKVVALRTTNNINIMIKDLFHNPPSYKSNIVLSFKPLGGKAKGVKSDSTETTKRPGITPITFSGDASQPKKSRGSDVKIYSPPSGKYSDKAGAFTGRGRGRGRGGRGRGYGGGYRGGFTKRW